jgi:WD40 repeat protein
MNSDLNIYYDGIYTPNKYKQLSVDPIGSGAFSLVYLAQDTNTKEKRAIKFMLNSKEITNEITIMFKCKSEYVIKIFDCVFSQLNTGIVMEYYENGDLDKEIISKKNLDLTFDQDKIFIYLFDLVEGMNYLHSNQIIHRDIKPENIYLANNGHIKLGDFNVSNYIDVEDMETFTHFSTYAGTEKYMSPEMLKHKKYCFKTDVYSAGCTLFELITLEKYYDFYNIQLGNLDEIKNILTNLLKMMLEADVNIRKDSKEIKNELGIIYLNHHMKLSLTESTDNQIDLIKRIEILEGHTNYVNSIVLLPDKNELASCSDDKTIRFWNLNTHEQFKILEGHTASVKTILVLSDELRLASCGCDNTIRIWSISNGEQLLVLNGHTNWIKTIILLTNEMLASCSDDKTIRIWNYNTGEQSQILEGHSNYVKSLAYLPNGNLASGSTDCTIRIWDIKNEGKELKIFIGHTSTVWTLVVLNNDNLASGSSDDRIIIWNMDGIKLREIKGHNGCILKLIVLNDSTLVSGSVDNSIRFWNPRNGKQLKLLQGHTDWILSLVSLPNNVLASSSRDRSIRLWINY